MNILFDKGTILIDEKIDVPFLKWDRRVKKYRAELLFYLEILKYLNKSNISYEDNVLDLVPRPFLLSTIKLRNLPWKVIRLL